MALPNDQRPDGEATEKGACWAGDIDALPELTIDEVLHNRGNCHDSANGGFAQVFMAHWVPPPSVGGESSGVLPQGSYVALKNIHPHDSFGRVETPEDPVAHYWAGFYATNGLRTELDILSKLHKGGCGARVVRPLAVVRWDGEWSDDEAVRASDPKFMPLHGYAMPGFERGSVATLLRDICSRRLPEGTAQRLLNMRGLSSELATMLGELHKMHTTPGVEMMTQDLTLNNLVVDDSGGGLRLLLIDPAMARNITQVPNEGRQNAVMGTWLWGCMRVRSGSRQYDPTADQYSMSFIAAEMWLVAEGATGTSQELIELLGLDSDGAQGVQFMRCLVWEVVRGKHHASHMHEELQHLSAVIPRVKRHLPVSWLGAWLMLLGFRDYREQEHLTQGLPCLRPGEELMLELAQLWARVAAAAEALPGDLTVAEACSEQHKALVQDMCLLFSRLKDASHLHDAGAQAVRSDRSDRAPRHPVLRVWVSQKSWTPANSCAAPGRWWCRPPRSACCTPATMPPSKLWWRSTGGRWSSTSGTRALGGAGQVVRHAAGRGRRGWHPGQPAATW